MKTFLPSLDQVSFFLGIATGLLLSWVIGRIKPIIIYFRQRAKEGFSSAQARLTISGEDRFRNDMLRLAQKQHLAASFCSLDDILVEPKIIAPPLVSDPDREHTFRNTAHQLLPYIPDFPELLSTYYYPTLRLAEAMQGGANLILMGDPGSGKTVALSDLTSQVARHFESTGTLKDLLPVLVHAADLNLPLKEPGALVSCLVDALLRHVSPLTLPHLSGLLREGIQTGKLLLLIDGLDELPPQWTDLVRNFIEELIQLSPNLRIIISASLEYYGGLAGLGLIPVAMNAWNKDDRAKFMRRWLNAWERLPLDKTSQEHPVIDTRLAAGWLKNASEELSPIEFTLRLWSALSGDSFGMSTKAVIEAHIRRLIRRLPSIQSALSQLAYNALFIQDGLMAVDQIERALAEISINIQIPDEELAEEQPTNATAAAGQQEGVPPAHKLMNKLVESGLWVEHTNNRLRFRHLHFAAALAGLRPQADLGADLLQQQPPWVGSLLTVCFASFNRDISPFISKIAAEVDPVLKQNSVDIVKIMRRSSPNQAWRIDALRNIFNELQNQDNPLSLKAKLITGLALSGDNGIPALFRRFFSHTSIELRLLSALGSGLIGDKKAINELVNLAMDPDTKVRQAACLALGALDDEAAIEQIALILIRGDDQIKRTAAEALAHHPGEGHETLKEGASYKDLRVRRAVIYGLAELNQPWVLDTLQEMQVKDEQWIVQSTAEQVRNQLIQPHTSIPKPYPALEQTTWIIEYAAQAGHGVQDEESALVVLANILNDGDRDQCIAALDRLRFVAKVNDQVINGAATKLNNANSTIKEMAYSVLWHLERSE